MPEPKDLMGLGLSAPVASELGNPVSAAITAAGTTIADATQLIAKYNIITTAAASTGVKLPLVSQGTEIVVYNAGASSLSVYPQTASQQINAGAAGAAQAVASGAVGIFYRASNTRWIFK